MIDIDSYGQLTLSPIASEIHKIVGLPHQLNVTIRLYSTQSGIVCFDCCHIFNNQHFFNSWIILICGCLLWFCRPTTCKEYIAVAQPSCLSNTEFHFTARYMPKRQGSASVLFFVGIC